MTSLPRISSIASAAYEASATATYEQFKEQWLLDVMDGSPSAFAKGVRFGEKIIRDWLDISDDDEDLVIIDGSGDGGLDLAYLKRGEDTDEGDTWYIVQSKYGTAFRGYDTIRVDGYRVLDTLTGRNERLSSSSMQVVEKLNLFRRQDRRQTSKSDRLVLVFATEDPIPPAARDALHAVRVEGMNRLVPVSPIEESTHQINQEGKLSFHVEEVSLYDIYEALDMEAQQLTVSMKGNFIPSQDFLLGVVPLTDLFDFLKEYRSKSGNLDRIYDKNVRKYLGLKRRINKGIAETLNTSPEKFGLYNNGITIVASGRSITNDRTLVTLTDPYIVNGCQTTRTVWEVLDGKLNVGGTGSNPDIEDWKSRAARGGVVTKIVHEEADHTDITLYTNSQTAVRQQDFITLKDNFQSWAREMGVSYRIFLEIQRGGKEAHQAYEKQHPEQPKFVAYVNAFDLLKVYGAGWLGKPGTAFGKNAPFLPDGLLYKEMVETDVETDVATPFGVHDLYAAYAIKREADEIGFGRQASQPSRRQSRFLFYFVIIDMLTSVVKSMPDLIGNQPFSRRVVTDSVIRLVNSSTGEGRKLLSSAAVGVIDSYLTSGEASAHNEASFIRDHNGDLNGFLKADNLGTENHSPLLLRLLESSKLAFSMALPGMDKTRREIVAEEIQSTPLPDSYGEE